MCRGAWPSGAHTSTKSSTDDFLKGFRNRPMMARGVSDFDFGFCFFGDKVEDLLFKSNVGVEGSFFCKLGCWIFPCEGLEKFAPFIEKKSSKRTLAATVEG